MKYARVPKQNKTKQNPKKNFLHSIQNTSDSRVGKNEHLIKMPKKILTCDSRCLFDSFGQQKFLSIRTNFWEKKNSHLIQDAHKIHLASKNFSPSEQISEKKTQSYCTH